MKGASHRFKSRKNAIERLGALFEDPSTVEVIHYSCESFYDRPNGTTPRITSIAVHGLASAQTRSFSIHKVAEQRRIPAEQITVHYDDLEKQMLDEFYEFVKNRLAAKWVNWNMININYGFPAIEHRYKILGGTPVQVPESNLYNLAHLLPRIYGANYSGHPRLQSLVQMNDITDLDFLTGKEEADAFNKGDYVALHQSTLRKVQCISTLAERAWEGTLKTNSNWYEKHGSNIAGVVEAITDHWLFKLLGAIGIVVSFIGIVVSLVVAFSAR